MSNPSPITPEAEAELDAVLKRLLADVDDSMEFAGTMWKPKETASAQVTESLGKAKQSLIRLLVRERVDEATKAREVSINHRMDSPQEIVVVLAARVAHLESLLQEDNPPIW